MNNHHTTLNLLKPHQIGIITKLNTSKELENRLMALGLRVGKEVELIRKAIFAGPIHIRIGTTEVMLRRADAKNIEINPIQETQKTLTTHSKKPENNSILEHALPSLSNVH